MDDADRATDLIENRLQDALAEVRSKPSLIPTGACYYCGDPVAPHHLFCSSDCSVDWKNYKDSLKRNGKM